MCLLVMVWRPDGAQPLVVAANRDERLDRRAEPIAVLQESGPRVLGGRDGLAGGTWLAVNEHGLVAGLTNTPTASGRDPFKRTRGLLPIWAARHRSAEEAVAALVRDVVPADFNPAWLLVGDRRRLFAVTVAGDRPTAVALDPGVHVLENGPPGVASAKVRHVTGLVAGVAGVAGGPWAAEGASASGTSPGGATGWSRLAGVLADHRVPDLTEPPISPPQPSPPQPSPLRSPEPSLPPRRLETLAACVHADGYGTRSAAIVAVPADPTRLPALAVADGPPCTAPFVDRSPLWDYLSAAPGPR